MALIRPLLALALLAAASSLARCSCEEPPPPPPPIGDGDPVDPPDAGDVYKNDAGPVVCTDDENEDNDVRGEAVAVTSADALNGTVCGEDDDWYSVLSSPGCTVFAQVENEQGPEGTNGDVDMLMFDPDGQLVGASNTPGAGETLAVEAAKDGAYAVRLRAGSRDIAPYSLTLTSTCAADLTCPEDDRLEDNDSAASPAQLAEGAVHDGIVCGADEDWFFVPVTIGCIADARLSFSDAIADIDLELYRGDGTTRVAASAGSGDTENITRVVTEGGMRYKVFRFGGADANTYRFLVNEICPGTIACPSDDPFEPNDDKDAARQLFSGLDEAIGVICGDDDFYKVSPTAGCNLHATLTFEHDEGDLDLFLQKKSDGSELASSRGTTDVETIDFTPNNGDALVFKVAGFSGATNVYRLHVETICP
jgi:hypothetical protein